MFEINFKVEKLKDSGVLIDLIQAIEWNFAVEFEYKSKKRLIQPLKILNYNTVWYMIRQLLLKSQQKQVKKWAIKTELKVGTKMVAQKLRVKIPPKILSKTTAKLYPKTTDKISTKWIPLIREIISAGGVNVWVLDGIARAAENYYKYDYILISSDLSDEIIQEMSDIKSDIKEYTKDEMIIKIQHL